MNVPFSAMITPEGTISFTHHDGRIYQILKSHPSYGSALETARALSHDPDNAELREELYDYSQPRRLVAKSSDNRIQINGEDVTFDGKPADPFLAKRLIWIIENGMNPEPLYNFLVNLDENPSFHSVQQLYRFMDAAKMAITSDGMILAYKRVRGSYFDIHSNTMDNSVGNVVEMPRNGVNDNPNQTCADGLHVCSMSYLPRFGVGEGNRVVICEIHPRDVVSVPNDYQNAKMRVCRYVVVGEVHDTTDILGSRPIMDDWSRDDDDEDDEIDNWGDDDWDDDTLEDETEAEEEAEREQQLADEEAMAMDQLLADSLTIQFNNNGVWQEVLGHCCYSEREMNEYVATLGAGINGGNMRVASRSTNGNPVDGRIVLDSITTNSVVAPVSTPVDFNAKVKEARETVATALKRFSAVSETYLTDETRMIGHLIAPMHMQSLSGVLKVEVNSNMTVGDVIGEVLKLK